MRLVGYMVFQYLCSATLPDARLTGQKYDLPLPIFHLIPAFQKQPNFLLSTNQRC